MNEIETNLNNKSTKEKVKIRLNDKTEIKVNDVKIPNLVKIDIDRNAENWALTTIKIEFYVLNSDITFN